MITRPSLNIIYNQPSLQRVESILKYWLAMDTPCHLPGLKFVLLEPSVRASVKGALKIMTAKLLMTEHLDEEKKKFCLEVIKRGMVRVG